MRFSLYKNAIFLMLNNTITALLGFVFWNIMARFFTPAQVGIASALLAAAGLIGTLAALGLSTGLLRFTAASGDNARELINSVFTLLVLALITGSLIYLVGIKLWTGSLSFIRDNIFTSLGFIFVTVVLGLTAMVNQALIAGRSSQYVFYKESLSSILKMPIPVFLFAWLGGYGIFLGAGLASLIAIFLALFWMLPNIFPGYRPRPALVKKQLGEIIHYSFGNYLASLFSCAINFIFPLLVVETLGPEKNAYFYIAWMLNGVIGMAAVSINTAMFAEAAYDEEQLGKNLRRAVMLTMVLLIPAVAGAFLIVPWLLHFFGPGYARLGGPLIRWLAPGSFPMAVGLFYMTINQISKKMKLVVWQSLISSVLTIGLSYYFMLKYGLNGIGMGYTLAQFLVALLVGYPLWRILQKKRGEMAPRVN